MIIDTTCSVVERKMKEQKLWTTAAKAVLPSFKVSDFVFSDNTFTTAFGVLTSTSNVFECTLNMNFTSGTSDTFNDCVTFNYMPLNPPKVTPEDIVDIEEQLRRTANNPDLTIYS